MKTALCKNYSKIGYLWSLDPSTWPEGWVSFWPVSPPFSIFDPSNFLFSTKRIIIFSLSFITSKKSQASLLVIFANCIEIVHRFLLQNGVWKGLWIWALNIVFKHFYLIIVIQKIGGIVPFICNRIILLYNGSCAEYDTTIFYSIV